jgi:hypothetical protein
MSNKEAIRPILKILDTTGYSFALSQSNQPLALTVSRRDSRIWLVPVDSVSMTSIPDETELLLVCRQTAQ